MYCEVCRQIPEVGHDCPDEVIRELKECLAKIAIMPCYNPPAECKTCSCNQHMCKCVDGWKSRNCGSCATCLARG
jgi:hypothetical protein